jgi:hypothetical protein
MKEEIKTNISVHIQNLIDSAMWMGYKDCDDNPKGWMYYHERVKVHKKRLLKEIDKLYE